MTDRIYYKIGDVADKFNVNASLIRYWEKEFEFIKPKKNKKGTRYYSKKDIDNIEIVYHLVKIKGMTIQGVVDYLKSKKEENTISELDVIATLKRTKRLLSEVKEALERKN